MLHRIEKAQDFQLRFKLFAPQIFGVVNDQLKWEPFDALTGCFIAETSLELRHRFVEHSKKWEEHRRLFDFGNESEGYRICGPSKMEHIRVAFKEEMATAEHPKDHWSYVGRDRIGIEPVSLNINPRALTAEITFEVAVLHELGHALGLEHEHRHPEAKCAEQVERNEAYSYYWWIRPTSEIDKLLSALRLEEIDKRFPYDRTSIMHYPFPAVIFKDGEASNCFVRPRSGLSDLDRSSIVKLYPVDAIAAADVFNKRIAWASAELSKLPLWSSQRVMLGEELTRTMAQGRTGGVDVVFKLGDIPFEPFIAEGPTERDRPKGCTPGAYAARASCSLSPDRKELRIKIE